MSDLPERKKRPPKTIVVVPCFNEAHRLQVQTFQAFCEAYSTVRFVFVNDGSTDATLDLLRALQEKDPFRFLLVDQQPNQGKAAAVRSGMLEAFREKPHYAGYWDADLATPLDEIPRFVELLEERAECEVVFGSRVKLLGRSIRRNPVRHYLGRVFATVVSASLKLPIYDTQCGAKMFRVSPEIERLFGEPFCAGWIFDVEIIARLIQARRGTDLAQPDRAIYEYPLNQWHDIVGSKVRASDFLRAIFEIGLIYRRYLTQD
ncbi:MAG: glycosyltransferase [Deltaproteobacteria bacterium]|nr:glycosyltransferase [Deltaproteobacteria bacterium]